MATTDPMPADGRTRAKEQARADRARYRTMRNLVGSLVLCFLFIGFLALVTWRPQEEKVRPVDYTEQLAEARKVAPYRVLAPQPLPGGWQATSAEVRAVAGEPVTWHLGVLTPDRRYVGLEQSNDVPKDVIAAELGNVRDDGVSRIGTVTWQRKVLLDRDERAIVLSAPGVTTILTGPVDYPTLESLATTLR
jgi:hypothetical protein